MGRQTKRVTIRAPGRDAGKTFELLEMPADQGERWANRAIIALANAGAKLPEGVLDAGMAGLEISFRNVLVTSIRSLQGLDYPTIEPLLNEMKMFISWVPPGDPSPPLQAIFPGDASQIEEIATWWTLRYELLQLHLGFSLAAALSTTESNPPAPTA